MSRESQRRDLSLILLGAMLAASDEQRKKIDPSAPQLVVPFLSPVVSAFLSGDKRPAADHLKASGVALERGKSVLESLCRRLSVLHSESELEAFTREYARLVPARLTEDSLDQIQSLIEKARVHLRNVSVQQSDEAEP